MIAKPPAKGSIATVVPGYKSELQVFENSLMQFIASHGLPTQNVLVPVAERIKVFGNVEDVLALLGNEHKEQSIYISKFIAAAASGLFDAALNYLWDETIHEMRKRVIRYDLEYFFDLAVTNPEKRRKLSNEDDLEKLDDNELIRGAGEIGLISDLGYKHLDFIRYMRNWASAAHPNQNQITGLQLITWLETCIKEVITLPETNATAQIRKLLANVKTNALNASGARNVGTLFAELTTDQSSNLMAGFFGIYTNEQTLPLARANVNLLAPMLWPLVDESTRKGFGVKYQQFTANNDAARALWAREFLDAIGGASYIPDGIRAAEIETALDELLTAHNGWSNFGVEPAFALRLESLIGEQGAVPSQIVDRYIDVLVEVFLTNGNGVAWAANPIYERLLARLDATQSLLAILSFRKKRIASKLQFRLCQEKYRELLTLAKARISSPGGKEILATIENYRSPLANLAAETKLMEKVAAITKSLGF